jgi:V8-like Glu-specific endopeptidase
MTRNPRRQTRLLRKQPADRPGGRSSKPARTSLTSKPVQGVVTGLAVALTASLSLLTPGAGDPAALAATGSKPDAQSFKGFPQVGTLFSDVKGKLTHFCTATVIDSPDGDLLLTAAHCLEGKSLTPTGAVFFAPEYHDGKFPLGRFDVQASFTDSAWQHNRNVNDDFAFLTVDRDIQKKTGAETLRTGASLPKRVQVIGYPDVTDKPVSCSAIAHAYTKHGLHQEVFTCAGYTDGTSGGPFMINVKTNGDASVIGDIGGYEQGGDEPNVSYSAQYLSNMAALYQSVTAP